MEALPRILLQSMSHPGELTGEEIENLESGHREYPYFQLAHTLLAKQAHDHQTPDAYQQLGRAAIYAPNRRLLRKIFYENTRISWQPDPAGDLQDTPPESAGEHVITDPHPAEAPQESTIETEESPSAESYHQEVDERVDDTHSEEKVEFTGVANPDREEEQVYKELEENLRRLRQAKEESLSDEASETPDSTDREQEAVDEAEDAQAVNISAMNDSDAYAESSSVAADEIERYRQQQNELIAKFVNSDNDDTERLRPSPTDDAPDETDLSEESSRFNDKLITENLAEIMVKQGKKEKALEIYQQLELTNPEKKAYFAEKIEQLKQQ